MTVVTDTGMISMIVRNLKLLKKGYTYINPSDYFKSNYPEPEYDSSDDCDEEVGWVE